MRDGKFRRNADANVKGITGASAAPDIRGTGKTVRTSDGGNAEEKGDVRVQGLPLVHPGVQKGRKADAPRPRMGEVPPRRGRRRDRREIRNENHQHGERKMTDKERNDLLMEQIRTLKENAEAWKRAFLATEALLENVTRNRHEVLLAEARGKRDAEALGDAE